MAIYGIFGPLGSGKTTTANFFLDKWIKEGKRIITNSHLNIQHIYMTMDEIFEKAVNDTQFFRNKILFIDEFHLIMDSRRSNASVNVDFSQNILIQLGKLDCTLLYTAQLMAQMDLRVTQNQKYFIWCTKTDLYGNPIDEDTRIVNQPIKIKLQIMIVRSELDIKFKKATIPWETIQRLFKNFDTREIIKFDRNSYLK